MTTNKNEQEGKSNDEIADLFDELAYWYALSGNVDSYKISTYKNAAFNIRRAENNLCTASPSQIKSIKGIGPQLQNQIFQICQKNTFPELDKILDQIPKGVQEIASINGLGPSKVNLLWRVLNIETPQKLKDFIDSGNLEKVKGFGKKTVESISKEIDRMEENRYALLYAQADALSLEVLKYFQSLFPDFKFELIGDILRKSNVIYSIDILTNLNHQDLIEEISLMDKIMSKSQNPTSYDFEGALVQVYCSRDAQNYQQIREEHNFVKNGKKFPLDTPIIQTEAYYKDIQPHRDGWVTVDQIKGLIHCHTNYSDGKNSIEELAQACIERNMEYMVLTDHSQSAFYANGLNESRIKEQHDEIFDLNRKLAPFRIFKSIECDILPDGSLDYADHVLEEFDILVASIHSGLKMDKEKATERLLRAINTGYIDILGHWTGRLLLRRDGYQFDVEKVVEACLKNKVIIEINANPRRLDVDYYYLPYILDQGVKISINPDAHKIDGIDDIQWGVINAQKGGLTAIDNISSYNLEEFKKYFDIL